MRNRFFLCVILLCMLLFLPLLSLGANSKSDTDSSLNSFSSSFKSKESSPSDASAETDSVFRILDTASGEILSVKDRDFLYGAIATEVSPLYEKEALKAQAIAAYTNYSRLRTLNTDKAYDFSADPSNWYVYVSKEQMQERWGEQFDIYYATLTDVIQAVFGMTLQYEGELACTTYFAISSGNTESSVDVWGGDLPYLTAVASPGDMYASGYLSTAAFSVSDFKNAILNANLQLQLPENPETWVGAIERTNSGSVKTIYIGNQAITGNDARTIFGLRSSNFTVTFQDQMFQFHVKGYGHGVGMSQVGANHLAKQGFSFAQILAWYYPGTTLC